MPVTARLSLGFYEKLGEAVAKELVDWFNDVDTAYRSDLREFNELNFARFDAKLEQRFAQADAKLEQRLSALKADMDARFAAAKTDMDVRFAAAKTDMDVRFASAKALAELRTEMEQRFRAVDQRLNGLEVKLEAFKSEIIRWMFVFWTGTTITFAGLVLIIVRAK